MAVFFMPTAEKREKSVVCFEIQYLTGFVNSADQDGRIVMRKN